MNATTKRTQNKPRWSKRRGSGSAPMTTYELRLNGQTLAIAQPIQKGPGSGFWFWYGMGQNTAGNPRDIDAVKAEAEAFFRLQKTVTIMNDPAPAPIENSERLTLAEALGRQAHAAGLPAIPARDPALIPVISTLYEFGDDRPKTKEQTANVDRRRHEVTSRWLLGWQAAATDSSRPPDNAARYPALTRLAVMTCHETAMQAELDYIPYGPAHERFLVRIRCLDSGELLPTILKPRDRSAAYRAMAATLFHPCKI